MQSTMQCSLYKFFRVLCRSRVKGVCYLYNNNNSKVFMSAFRNLNSLTCHNKIKYNDDTNS